MTCMAEVNQERRLARGQSAANNSCGVCVPKGTSVLPHPGNIREEGEVGEQCWETVFPLTHQSCAYRRVQDWTHHHFITHGRGVH